MINPRLVRRVNQRREPRYALPRRTLCRLSRATGGGPWLALVRNISAEGIGIILRTTSRGPLKAGMLLTVELQGKNQHAGALKMIIVTHAAPQAGGPWWVVGGRFASKLSDEDVRSFL
jgi:hypothetical protein